MKIGLMMGSFNPVHMGHLIVANTIIDNSDLDEIWFVISPKSPDKVNMELLDHNKRAEILRKTLKGNNKLTVSTIEFDMEQPNYTYKTLRRLREKHPTYEFCIIMGSDNANNLQQWVGVDEWKIYHKLYVVERPNSYLEEGSLGWYGKDRYRIFKVPEIGISSTIIRNKIKNGESIKYLVPDNVLDLIELDYKFK